MLLRRLLLVCVTLFAVACAHVDADVDTAVIEKELAVVPVAPVTEVALPVTPQRMSSALLFNVLAGEIAGQRGNIEAAAVLYLRAARQSQDPQIALRAAQIALYKKDFSSARLAVDIFMEAGVVDSASRQLALIVYLRTGAIDESVKQVNGLLRELTVPKQGALLAIGDVISRNTTKTDGLLVINMLLQENPQDASVYLMRSQHLLDSGLVDRALLDVRQAVELEPSWSLPHLHYAKVLEAKGEVPQAVATLKLASDQFKSKSVLMAYAKLLLKQERYSLAKEQFQTVLLIDERTPKARFSLALIHMKLNELVEAELILQTLFEDKVFPAKAAFYLGRISYFRKDYQSATGWFERVPKGGDYVEAQSNISRIKFQLGDLEGAVNVVRKLRAASPEQSTKLYLLEADLLLSESDYLAVYALMNEAVGRAPTDLTLRYTRAIAATELNKDSLAEEDLLFVLAREPANANALNALGYLLASKTFRFEQAREYLTKALALKPNDPAVLDSMGWLEYREGRYVKSLALLLKAYKAMPEGEIAAHLGEVMWMLGRRQEAVELWQKALQQDAANRYLLEVVDRLQ
ncbi:MAG: tetratricopeptide repeat protein [Cycloclasticus sp.]